MRSVVATTAVIVAFAASCTGCSSGSASTSSSGSSTRISRPGGYAVASTTQVFVDTTRSTPATSDSPAHAGRTLTTTIYYPRGRGPFPLIVFAHGYQGTPADYSALLSSWASAGYVVAAPAFPLTSLPGSGADLSDYVNQPKDMSFVITSVVNESKSRGNPLAGLVDSSEIGAAGHSLGGVTTLGLVANSCCRDKRVKAAVVMAGDQLSFPSGRAELGPTVPMLLVQGNADQAVPYSASVDAFNEASVPKGLLTLEGGDHGSPVDPGTPYFTVSLNVTTDFFDAYLKHEQTAKAAMQTDARSTKTKFVFVSNPGNHLKLPTPPTLADTLRAAVAPKTGLRDGEAVTVTWRGYQPGVSVNILECSKSPPTGPSDCDLNSGTVLLADPLGEGTFTMAVHTGPIGSGVCDATHNKCVIVVNQGGSTDPSSSVILPISFAA